MAYVRSPLTNVAESPRLDELADFVAIGVHRGIRALARVKRYQADRLQRFAAGVEHALESSGSDIQGHKESPSKPHRG